MRYANFLTHSGSRKRYRMLLVICLTVLPVIATGTELKGVTATDDGDITRVVVQLSEPARYKTFVLENPPRLVVDLLDTVNSEAVFAANSRQIQRVRSAPRNKQHYRLVFDLHKLVTYQHRTVVMSPATSLAYHIILEMHYPADSVPPKPAAPIAKPFSSSALRDVVVVIDPGHGGKDSGAIGKANNYEKHIVLEASQKLHRLLNGKFGMRAYLTRDDDRYLSLRERIKIARDYSADIFISVHADSLPEHSKVKGAAVYMLSGGGASSEAARWLVQRHNADQFVDGASIRNKDKEIASILMDFSQSATMEHSAFLAKSVLSALAQKTSLRTDKVEVAEFAVLTSPDIPSLLLELGYLSNPAEERKLRQVEYQQSLMQAVGEGIQRYLGTYAPDGSWFQQYQIQQYIVRSGDSLWALARRNQVSLATVKQVSGIKSEHIFVGQRLWLPAKKR